MSIVNLKRSQVEKEGRTLLGGPADAEKDDYYYGLNVTLQSPELDTIGLKEPKVGERSAFDAIMKVTSHSMTDEGCTVVLQITDLGMKPSPGEKAPGERESTMYGGENGKQS